MRGTGFFCQELTANISQRVFLQRDRRVATLLRAVVNQSLLADVEIAGAGAATPLVGTSLGDVVLKSVDPRETALLHGLHLMVDGSLFVGEGLELSAAIVNDSDGGAEAELQGAAADRQGILRVLDSASHHRVDVHVEVGVFGEEFELLVENFQAL